MRWYTENEIATLLEDPVARQAMVGVFLKLTRAVNGIAMKEGMWGPANETVSQVEKSVQVHFDRISEEKRKK